MKKLLRKAHQWQSPNSYKGDTVKLEIVTTEETIFSDDVDIVIAPGTEGQLGILPRHASLLTALNSGDIVVRKDRQESVITVNGGFLEVAGDHVRVLASSNQ